MNTTPARLRHLILEAAADMPLNLTTNEISQLAHLTAMKAAQMAPPIARLSPRLSEVLFALAEGETRSETAARLHVSEDTVKTHRLRLYKRLGARSGAHAVAIASRRGLLQTDATAPGPQKVRAVAGGARR